MKRQWVTSDLHLGHRLLAECHDEQGVKLRPFSSIDEMNRELIARWNARVEEHDRVYVLGDIAINRRYIALMGELKGKKVLVSGNHDIFKTADYLPYFDRISGYKVLDNRQAILSHIPLHPSSLGRFGFNIHGHLHQQRVLRVDGTVDPRYCNVCVEHWDYAPVLVDHVLTLKPSNL